MPLPVNVLVIGAGNRGQIYSFFAKDFPERMKVVGVADSSQVARHNFQMKYSIEDCNVFDDWRRAAAQEKFADAVIIATPDRLHKEPAVAFAEKGYHILLEKPMAVTIDDCKEIVAASKKHNVILSVCHVLRYSPVVLKVKELLSQGVIGEVVHIQHLEPVGFYHFAHSFVRGNWRNEKESTFSLMAKSCHDIDIINSLVGKRCIKVSSFGSLSHFTEENKPQGAASRCLNCSVEQTCPYSAKKFYLEGVKNGNKGWPISTICEGADVDIESVTKALRKGPYGRCVYECDNDVVTHQVVNMEFEGGVTAAFTMVAFTEKLCTRKITIYGTKKMLAAADYRHFLSEALVQPGARCPRSFPGARRPRFSQEATLLDDARTRDSSDHFQLGDNDVQFEMENWREKSIGEG
ncbi:putative oxidoreductase YteT isoform X2 [Narcine bancroftii]|uniref:putative oxidoreductase YteT isoform X2 n=1 Tax=Narcine bancroftii TaxID=1343680 RepID=UPI0038319957